MSHQIPTKAVIIIVVSVAMAMGIAGHFLTLVTTDQSPTTMPNGFVYLLSIVGPCTGPGGYVPCFGGNITQAEVFNCANSAASASGCTQLVADPSNSRMNYTITVWYLYTTHSAGEPSWANCQYESSGDPGQQHPADCISTNSTAFTVTQPAPPPL